jgi:hypothetical protein
MSDIKLDDNGDVEFVNGELSLTSGIDGIRQHLKQRLQTFLGEFFLNFNIGLPYFQQIFVKTGSPTIMEQIFVNKIITTPGIIELLLINIDIDSSLRILTLNFTALSTQGKITFNNLEIGI